MKDDDGWSEGSFEDAGVFAGTTETDCSNWDSEVDSATWSEGQFVSAAIPVLGDAAGVGGATSRSATPAIRNEASLIAARERISQVLDLLARERQSGRPEEFAITSQAYRAEVELL